MELKETIKKQQVEIQSLKDKSAVKTAQLEIDASRPFFKNFCVDGKVVKIKSGGSSTTFQLCFTNKLEGRQQFMIEILELGDKDFYFGVTTADLRNSQSCARSMEAMSLNFYNG